MLATLGYVRPYALARLRSQRASLIVTSVSAQATSENAAPTAPTYAMPMLLTTAPPTAVPNEMPTLSCIRTPCDGEVRPFQS